jgi:multicomponent Na+:H+ antiporter subunit G
MDILVMVLLINGIFFIMTGTIGLLRLPDVYNRMHAPTKATTLGVSSIILAAIGHSYGPFPLEGLKEILAVIFLFLTMPVGGHMLAKAAYHSKIKLWEKSIIDERAGKKVIGGEDVRGFDETLKTREESSE